MLVSLLASFIFSFAKADDWFGGGAGGAYGYFAVTWMKNMIGGFGTGSIVGILFFVWLIFVNGKIIDSIFAWVDKVTAPKPKKETELSVPVEDVAPVGNLYEDLDVEVPVTCEEADDEDVNPGIELSVENVEDENEDGGEEFPEFEIAGENNLEEECGDDEEELEVEVLSVPDEAPVTQDEAEEEFEMEPFEPRLDLSSYQAPPLSLLKDYKDKWYVVTREELEKNNRQIVKTLANSKIGITRISARVGPTVTLYEIEPAPGVRVAQIKRLEEDIQLSLAAKGVRVVNLPGTRSIGIEVANEKPSTVSMLSVLEDEGFRNQGYDLPVALGMTITNEVMHFDLAKMPHLLVAGATGQGKSVGL